jgi:TPP-dependent indolepyruvate ferredoxin oxidoreductase alpha subunit
VIHPAWSSRRRTWKIVFYTAIEAVNIARKYSVPVILLTDQGIATRIEAFTEPNLEKVCQDISPDFKPVADHKPYDLAAADGITHHLPPGTRIASGKYPIVTGLEHDELGHPTGSPKLHMQMMAKRRKKLQALGTTLPNAEDLRPERRQCLLVGWGSTQGPIKEAVDRARAAGDSVSSIHIKHINPLPPGLENIFSGFNHILVVEMNDEGLYGFGQLGALLRARYCDPKIRGINKTDGLTFKVKEILERAKERVATATKPAQILTLSTATKICMSNTATEIPNRADGNIAAVAAPTIPAPEERKGLTKKEIAADHPTWCPGCGDFSVLALYFKLIEKRKMWHEKITTIAGIGCSSRFPYFVQAHGAHFIHGRALPFASGVSLSRPDLHVFVFGGDGDAFSIGGNHFNHTARKNIKMTYCVMDNWVYGLTRSRPRPRRRSASRARPTNGARWIIRSTR